MLGGASIKWLKRMFSIAHNKLLGWFSARFFLIWSHNFSTKKDMLATVCWLEIQRDEKIAAPLPFLVIKWLYWNQNLKKIPSEYRDILYVILKILNRSLKWRTVCLCTLTGSSLNLNFKKAVLQLKHLKKGLLCPDLCPSVYVHFYVNLILRSICLPKPKGQASAVENMVVWLPHDFLSTDKL